MAGPRPRGAGSRAGVCLDYQRSPRVELVSERVRVQLGDRLIADRTRALRVLESGSLVSANPEWSGMVAPLRYGRVLGAPLAYGPLSERRERR